ncbi:BQ2448_6103 [Microbotryum intermedium]|uniref:BQ2448_6103 protein n=1 Tax=Microbotryum intermedium TaxID=269621 RepID=A0A238FNU6_9BASI|nr:BQ2448_6103 [Microbotryum intermedium]
MTPMLAVAQTSAAVCRLPPELLSDIAAFVDQRGDDDRDSNCRHESVFQDLSNSAATCRAWRGPFSRQLMQELHVTIKRFTELKSLDLTLARQYPIHRLHVSLDRHKTATGKFFFDLLSLTRSSVKTLCVSQSDLVLDLFLVNHDLRNLEQLELEGVDVCHLKRFGYMRPVLPKLTVLKCRNTSFHALSRFARHISTPELIKVELTCGHGDLYDYAGNEALEIELLTCKGLRLREIYLCLEDNGLDADSWMIKLFVRGLRTCRSLQTLRLDLFTSAGRKNHNLSNLESVRPLLTAIPSKGPFHTLRINLSIYARRGFEVCAITLLQSLQTSELPRLVQVQVWFLIGVASVGQSDAIVWTKSEVDSQLISTSWEQLRSWSDKKNVTLDLNVTGAFDW